MNNYEITFITLENLSEKPFKDVLDKLDGRILSISSIGERQFAYPIKKETRGVYTTVLFEMDPSKFAELNKKLSLTEEILRFLITVKKASAMKAMEEASLKAKEVAEPIEIEKPKEIAEVKEIAEPKEIEAPVEIEAPIEITEPAEELASSEVEKEKKVEKEKPKVANPPKGETSPKAGKIVKKAEKVEPANPPVGETSPEARKVSKEVTEIETETESEEDRLKELDKKLDELLKD